MNFEFTEPQINYIVHALAARPFGEVCELITDIQRQAAQQSGQARPQPVEEAQQLRPVKP